MRKKIGLIIPVMLVVAMAVTSCGSNPESPEPKPSDGASDGQGTSQADIDRLRAFLPAEIKDQGYLNFGAAPHPPYEYYDDQKWSGAVTDMREALTEALGLELKTTLVAGNVAALLGGLLSKRYDAFMGPSEPTKERQLEFDTVTWLNMRTGYFIKDDGKSQETDIITFCGETIAFLTGTSLVKDLDKLDDYCVAQGKAKTERLEVPNTDSSVLAVKAGRAFAAIATGPAAGSIAKEQDDLKLVLHPLKVSETQKLTGMLLPKEPGVAEALREAMQFLIDNGTYMSILEKYGLDSSAVETAVMNP